MNIASAIAAIREDRFGGFLQGCTAQKRTKLAAGHIDVRYANWFSGLGMNLLQLASVVARRRAYGGRSAFSLRPRRYATRGGDYSRESSRIRYADRYMHLIQVALGHPEVVRLLLSH